MKYLVAYRTKIGGEILVEQFDSKEAAISFCDTIKSNKGEIIAFSEIPG